MPAWFEESIPVDLTVDVDGKAVPLRDQAFVKEAPDFQTFLKNSYNAHREVGARLPVRLDKNDPEAVGKWKKEHLPKLYDAGILPKPPADPKDYGIKRPDELPDGLRWNDERAGKFEQLGLKHGITKEAMKEFHDLHTEAMLGVAKVYKGTYEEGMAKLREKYGDQLEPRMEESKRLSDKIFGENPEALELLDQSGYGSHPAWIQMFLDLAPLAKEDSTYNNFMQGGGIDGGGGGVDSPEYRAAVEYHTQLMTNPNHPDYQKFHFNDPDVVKKLNDLYAKAVGNAPVVIGGEQHSGGNRIITG